MGRGGTPLLKAPKSGYLAISDISEQTNRAIQLKEYTQGRESLGQLVRLGFDVTVFTPASYQRHRL